MANGSARPVARPLDVSTAAEQPRSQSTGAPGGMWQLLAPRALASRNRYHRLSRNGRVRLAGFVLLALLFGTAIFLFFHRALSYFLSVPEFGAVLTYKLLGMVFVTFF